MTVLITFVGYEIVSPTTYKDRELMTCGDVRRCHYCQPHRKLTWGWLRCICSSSWKCLCCLLAIQILQEYLTICWRLVFLQVRIPITELTTCELWEIILDWKPIQIKISALSRAKGSKYHWVWPSWRELSSTAFPCEPLFWQTLKTGWGFWWKLMVIFFSFWIQNFSIKL